MNIALNLILHDNQKVIHKSRAKFKVIKAGKRFGKTLLALFELAQVATRKKGVYWYIAPFYSQARDIAWDLLLWLLPKELIKNKWATNLKIELKHNGSIIVLKGADNPNSLRGIKIDGYVLDECAYMDGYLWGAILMGQLSEDGFALFISSPNSTGRNWYSSFYDQAKLKETKGDKDWAAFYFTIFDNPTLSKDFIKQLEEQNTNDTWNLEYLAIESAHSGIVVNEFNFDKHVQELHIKEDWVHVRGIDWGIAHPTTCVWVAVDVQKKKVYVYDEYYRSGMLIKESCSVIKQKTNKQIAFSVIDPSTNKRNPATGRTDKDEFARYGVYCLAGDNRDRGWDIMKMFFKTDSIKINPKCKNLIQELKTYQYGDKTGDDCLDPLRYVLVKIHDSLFNGLMVSSAENSNFHKREMSIYDLPGFQNRLNEHETWVTEEVL